MVTSKINKIFKSISDPTRREIFNLLIIGSTALSITQITAHFTITRQGITKHIKVLSEAGLVDITLQNREKYCSANVTPLREIADWMKFYEKFWKDRLNLLTRFLDHKSKK